MDAQTIDTPLLERLYQQMQRVRRFDQRVQELFLEGFVKGTAHSYVGEEAIAVGACAAIEDKDYIVSHHRGHGHCIAKGADLTRMAAELFGRETGYSKGLGGSMHIADIERGILGANGIVGAGIGLGTGAALSAKLRNSGQICVVFFGDGASNEGIFHEALNMASIWKLPVVFVLENNQFGLSTRITDVAAIDRFSRRAASYSMPGETIDGNDVLAVYDTVSRAASRARNGEGPSLIECITWRWGDHSMRANLPAYRGEDEDRKAMKRKHLKSASAAPASNGTANVLPYPDFHFPGEVGRTYLESDPAQFPKPVRAPKGAPNILLILIDDCGFGQYGTFGGGIPSPTMDKLAAEGLRYNRFHTTALCSPTRAALITGRNHHSTSFAGITELATGYDGYTCILPRSCGTIGEVLRQSGYMTAWIGKNHNTPTWETSAAGPFDRWANGLGFDYFYGFNAGDMNHWNPILYQNRDLVPASTDPHYHLTTDIADKAISWVRQAKSIAPDRPYFLYVATGATHAPHHTPKDWIAKFKGKFDGGWDKYREETLARQKKLGVVPKDTKLTVRSKGLPAWDSLNAEQKRLYARMMEVFAGFAAHCDNELGRVVAACKDLPDADNTLIIYIAGDNGASAEGGIEGSLCENMFFNGFPEKWQDNIKAIDELGGPKHFNHFPSAWAHAMNTPFQWTKQVASHFGGTRNPMIISWPERIKDKGGLRSQFLHTIDIVPTLYEVCGVTAPTELNGVQQKPIEGLSFAQTFDDADVESRRKTQYFELGCNRGLYHEGWMASCPSFVPWDPNRGEWDPDKAIWELYKVDDDFSQANDVAKRYPEKLRQLQDMWWVEAAKYNVLPLDWRATIRMNAEAMGRPSLIRGRNKMTYYPGTIGLPDAASPPMCNKSWTITAEIEVPNGKAEGMIVTHGGLEGGYGLYLRDGKPTFVYNFLSVERMTFTGDHALPKGKTKLVVDFAYDGGGMGKGGEITMKANGKKIAGGRLKRTIPIQFSLGEGIDIGMDIGSPIDFTYELPFAFTGKIEKVTIELKPEPATHLAEAAE